MVKVGKEGGGGGRREEGRRVENWGGKNEEAIIEKVVKVQYRNT